MGNISHQRPGHASWFRLIRCSFIAAALLASLHVVKAADAPAAPNVTNVPNGRPRIGLVLGGGGAKGAAHIGVIKVLEELRIPIDCIAGTSMGSIVGAAYATGLSSQEIEQLMSSVNWADTRTSRPREDIRPHRKR